MAIGRFLMVACFSARLSVRRSLPCFDGLKLNLLSPNLLMAKLLMEIGLNPTLQASVTTSPIKIKKRSQERVKV